VKNRIYPHFSRLTSSGGMAMDEKFLEFWGNLLINAARSKKQTDDVNHWMQKTLEQFREWTGFPVTRAVDDMWAMFRKFYGFEHLPERSTEYQAMFKKASEDFQKSFADYQSMMGMVSKREHLALVERYEKLKETCADQEETINHLKLLLKNVKDQEEGENAVRNLQKIMKDQTDLFQKMMTGFTQTYAKESALDHVEQKGVTKNESKRPTVETNE
jgi:hypothetical protein